MDAKDILGLPKNFNATQEKKSRPPKDSQRKPDGISREVYALTGGIPPLMPAIDPSHLKRKPQPENEKITWRWLPFTSSARTDNLQLYHWVRVVNGVPPTGDYSFAKCNKSVETIKYTQEEYDKYLTDPAYTTELEIKVSLLEEENEMLKKQQELKRMLQCAPLPEPKFQLRRTGSALF